MRIARATTLICILVLVGAACSKSTPNSTPTTSSPTGAASSSAPADATVQATDSRTFSPVIVTIKAGQTVAWKNVGSLPHTVTFDNGPAYDEGLEAGETDSRTFAATGSFNYHCTIHGASMHGTIVVT